MHIDNTTAVGIVNNTIKRQRSRAMEMRYFWLLDQETQLYFKFYYHPGQESLADYPSKAHTGAIHTHVRPYYIHMNNSPRYLIRAAKPSSRRGCTEILGDPYYKGIPLPRISHNRELGRDSPLARTAVAAVGVSDNHIAKVPAYGLSSVRVATSAMSNGHSQRTSPRYQRQRNMMRDIHAMRAMTQRLSSMFA